MSVYVELVDYGWRLGPSCHMWADTETELHEMAGAIGLRREWFQPGHSHALAHYDLTTRRRAMAVARGAVEATRHELVAEIRRRRAAR